MKILYYDGHEDVDANEKYGSNRYAVDEKSFNKLCIVYDKFEGKLLIGSYSIEDDICKIIGTLTPINYKF